MLHIVHVKCIIHRAKVKKQDILYIFLVFTLLICLFPLSLFVDDIFFANAMWPSYRNIKSEQ